MHLVDEQERALPGLTPRAGCVEDLLEVGDAGEHGRELDEFEIGRMREQARDRGLAGAGRTPENERAERARADHAGQRAIRPEQVILAHDFPERLRTQLVGERARRVVAQARGGEQVRT